MYLSLVLKVRKLEIQHYAWGIAEDVRTLWPQHLPCSAVSSGLCGCSEVCVELIGACAELVLQARSSVRGEGRWRNATVLKAPLPVCLAALLVQDSGRLGACGGVPWEQLPEGTGA